MSLWGWILVASAVAFATKLVGYLLLAAWLDSEGFGRASSALTIALLSALVATNTFASGQTLALDSRVLALAAAGIALWRKLPFLAVVIIGAAAAALGRLAGLP
ncbi:MAG: AzlD domain-containing protein [Propionibacterium sp.]|nr:AzlD domain-containing protein [Propionibacterium sp.]